MKTAGEIVCDNRELLHPEAKPQAMIDFVRMIQADAIRSVKPLLTGKVLTDRLSIELAAKQIEKGPQ